jgi:putative ABC transport system permease protein
VTHLGLAWAQVRTRLGAMAAAVVVIGLGVGLAAGMLLANRSLRGGFARSVEAMAGRAELTVRPLSDGTVEQALVDRIEAVPGVAAAVPVLTATAAFDGAEARTLQLLGVDLLDDGMVRVYDGAPGDAAGIDDPLVFLNQPGSAIAPRPFLAANRVARGETVRLRTSAGRLDLTIRGVLEEDGVAEAFGGGFLVVDLYALQDSLGTPERVSWIDVAVAAGADVAAVSARLRDALPAHLRIETAAEKLAEHTRNVAGFEAMVNVVAVMGLLLAGLITSNRLATLYQHRVWEIAVLRGIGWSPTGLVRALLGEAALLSTLGALLGLPLGVLFAESIVGRLATTMSLNFQRTIAAAPVELEVLPLLLAALAGIGSGVAAGWSPARRAARGTILSLKLGRGRGPRIGSARWSRARLVVPVLAAIVLGVVIAKGSAALGGVAVVLLLAAGIVAIQPVLALASVPVGALSGEGARVGLRDQSRAPGRPIGAAAVLTIGLALVVWIANTTTSFEIYLFRRTLQDHRADILVDSKANLLAHSTGTLLIPAEILDELRRIPGVAAVGAQAAVAAISPPIGVFGEDRSRLLIPGLRGYLLEPGSLPDAFDRVARGEGFLVDRLFRDKHRATVGDPLRITTPSGPLELPILGVTETGVISAEGNAIVSLDVFRNRWHDDKIARAYVLAEDPGEIEPLRRLIEERFGERYGVRAQEMRSYADWIAANVRSASSFLYGMAAITLLVVLIGTADALVASVLERTREIGILRAIGYRPASMGGMVFAQSLAIGVTGACLAVAVGTGMSIAFVLGILPALLGWQQLEVQPTYGILAAVTGLGLVACLAGGLLPAARAARIPVATAIRHE